MSCLVAEGIRHDEQFTVCYWPADSQSLSLLVTLSSIMNLISPGSTKALLQFQTEYFPYTYQHSRKNLQFP